MTGNDLATKVKDTVESARKQATANFELDPIYADPTREESMSDSQFRGEQKAQREHFMFLQKQRYNISKNK